MNKRMSYLGIVAITLAAVLGIARTGHTARKPAAEVKIVSDDIGGVVTSSKGPEAGVWVIAETKDLPTGYRKIVVTDDQGRYVIPELPKANYDVWVRGYGLVDSPKVKAAPGKMLNLTAVIAPDRARSGAILSRRLLVFAAAHSAEERFPRHRRQGKRHLRAHQESGRVGRDA